MRLSFAAVLLVSCAYGQTCVPARILPTGTVTDSLDGSSCRLSDGSGYAGYRLALPVRGHIQIKLDPGTADLSMILRNDSGSALASGTNIQSPIESGEYYVIVNARVPGGTGL